MTTKIINKFGVLTGWNSMSVNLFGRDIEGFDEVNYNDTLDLEVAYGGGKYPVGMMEGNYKAEASINLYFEESTAIQKQLPKGTRIQDIPFFDIPVVFEHDGARYKDVLRNCRFKDNGREMKNGQGKTVRQFTLVLSHIDWNV